MGGMEKIFEGKSLINLNGSHKNEEKSSKCGYCKD
jgi:hypothetical protein